MQLYKGKFKMSATHDESCAKIIPLVTHNNDILSPELTLAIFSCLFLLIKILKLGVQLSVSIGQFLKCNA